MKWFYNRIYRKEKGFTLVELMIVIIILAVLTGIAIPSYLALRNRARIQATKSEIKNIATALEVYNADLESYPGALGDLETGGYMANVPDNDAWGNAYGYVSDGTTYTITSTAGTELDATDDIVNINGEFTPDT